MLERSRLRSLPRRIFPLGIVFLILNSCTPDVDPITTTVVLVRHAEKADHSNDPPLNAAGEIRARDLAHVLGETQVDVIYATPFSRTLNTARPLAEALDLEVQVVDAGEDYIAVMAELVLNEHQGELVVIVSHSNTVPEIIGALGWADPPTIEDDEYDDLYVMTISTDGSVTLLPLRYGAETP